MSHSIPRRWDLKDRILNRLGERKDALGGAAGRVDAPIYDTFLKLKWRVAAKRGIAIDHDAISKRSRTNPERHF